MRIRALITGVLSAAMIAASIPAHAEMVTTQDLLADESRAQQVERLQSFFTREDVRAQMEALGVESAVAAERVAALTDSELQTLSQNLDNLPAGGGALEVIGIVFLILLILELVGVTDFFKSV